MSGLSGVPLHPITFMLNHLNKKIRMKMKKMLMTTLLSIAMTVPALAQYGRPNYRRPVPVRRAPVRTAYYRPHHNLVDAYFGLRIGVNAATVSSEDRYLDGGRAQAGLNTGFVAGFQVAPATPIYLETGLSYMEKGGKGSYDGRPFTYSLNYLEMPFIMKYRIDLADGLSLQPFAGGFAAVGVSGKMKDFGSRRSYSAYDDEGFRRMDAGLRVGCGLQFGHLYTEVGYDAGLANISRDYFDTAHTGSFFATCGVNF